MAITYNWTIVQLDSVLQTPEGANYVVTAHWACDGTDGTHSGSIYSTCRFKVEQSPSFTPYANLTQNQVLGWCWANGVDKTSVENAVAQQIQNQVTPPVANLALPWA